MKRNTFIFTEREIAKKNWSDLAVKREFWTGSVLKAFSLAFKA